MLLDGLALLRRVRDGDLPAPPMAQMIGVRCTLAEPGVVAASLEHRPQLENADGVLYGGAAAVLLDATMGAAAHTLEPAGATVVTQDLTITYLKPVRKAAMPVTAIARVLNRRRTASYVVGEVRDCDDRIVAHAVGNFWTRTPTSGSVAE